MYIYPRLRSLIFRLTPEQAHHGTISMLRLGGSMGFSRALLNAYFRPRLQGPEVKLFGLTFKNPVGMAAGYDKDALGWRGLYCLGFSHIELGTVTPRPQPGNPSPRLFRLVEDQAVINRMGFNNEGAQFMAGRMQKSRRPKDLILGVNIGKNKDTPLESAHEDYLSLLRTFAPLADYLAVNISSPNTPGLRQLQESQFLDQLLKALAVERKEQEQKISRHIPILVKLAPDLSDAELESALDSILGNGMDGVIISNTTLRREGLRSSKAGETGGLSGAPLNALNTAMVAKTARLLSGKLPIVASGGIMQPCDAQAKLDAGASLIQLYSGLIYYGPELVRDVLNAELKV